MNIVKKLWVHLKEFHKSFGATQPQTYEIPAPPTSSYLDNLELLEKIQKLKQEITSLQQLVEYYKAESYKKKPKKEIKEHSPDLNSKLDAWARRVKSVGKCDTCGSTQKLTAHHLYDKSTHPSLKFIDENGVCLCESCHNRFHLMYTVKSHCTPKLYEKFKIKIQNEITMGTISKT